MTPEMVRAVGRMNRDGVLLLAGTDIAGPRIPGFSLQDELSMLVNAGLTPTSSIADSNLESSRGHSPDQRFRYRRDRKIRRPCLA